MKTDGLQAIFDALRTAPGDAMRSRILEGAGQRILTLPGASADLIGRMDGGEPIAEPREVLFMLLERALDAARMARENGQPEGEQFLAEIDAQLKERAAVGTLCTADRIALGRAYVQAGLPPSPGLAMTADDLEEFHMETGDTPDLDELLDSLRDEAGSEPMAIYMALAEMLATLPAPVRAMIVEQVCRRSDTVFARAGTYWLLDADPALRRAAAEGFLFRTATGQMDAGTVARLIGMRSWLPADGARDVLDRLIKEAMRREVTGGGPPKLWKLHRIVASIPDGAGAQSIAIVAQAGGQRVIAMLLLKQGFGVKDAYVISCSSASEQKRFAATVIEELDAEEVSADYVQDALAMSLGDGLESGLLPAPGLLDVAEVCGLQDLHPASRSVMEMLDTLATDSGLTEMSPQYLGRLVNRSGDWPEHFDVIESWFEDTGDMRDRLEAAASPQARERAMWHYLEGRRSWWARMFARTALTLRAAAEPGWIEFAATAFALEKGRGLRKTPIMEFIVWRSLANPEVRGGPSFTEASGGPDIDYLDIPDAVAPEKKNELARLLEATSISPDWLNGFLTVVVVSPKMVPPQKWLEPLFEVLQELPGEDSLQRFLDIVMLRYNVINAETEDPTATRKQFQGRTTRAWTDWCTGFVTAAAQFKSSWPARSMNSDDKAILRQIAEVASGSGEHDALETALPIWLARRRDVRS